jgi:hypothetical protein
MSKIALSPNASGSGTVTITAPNTNTNRTIALPDVAGNVVTTGDSATVSTTMLAGGHGGFKSMQVFSTAGNFTWTKPAGINTIKVYVTGGGAGAGAQGNQTHSDEAGGGGGGGTAIKVIDVSGVSSSGVGVGAGGTGGASGAKNNGTNGSTSSFGSYCTATGGGFGYNGDAGGCHGGEGGIGIGGDINLKGSGAQGGLDDTSGTPTYKPSGGVGGGSFWGGAGRSTAHSNGGVATRHGLNGGGGGCGSYNDQAGGNGGVGLVVVEEYA